MLKYLKWSLAAVVLILAGYGLFRFISDRLDFGDGKRAVETAHPFVQGVSSAAGEKLKQTLKETPDPKLEEDSELISRKLYPIVKGALKGQLDAIKNDPNRSELPETMIQTGRQITENLVKPFAEGVSQGSQTVLQGVDRGLDELRKFNDRNKDIIDSVQSGLKALGIQLEKLPPAPNQVDLNKPMEPDHIPDGSHRP